MVSNCGAGQLDAGGAEHDAVVLQVLADLLDGRVLQHAAAGRPAWPGSRRALAGRRPQRQVPALVLVPGQRHARPSAASEARCGRSRCRSGLSRCRSRSAAGPAARPARRRRPRAYRRLDRWASPAAAERLPAGRPAGIARSFSRQLAEAELLEQGQRRGDRSRPGRADRQSIASGTSGVQPHQLPAQQGLLAVLLQVLPPGRPGHFLGVLVEHSPACRIFPAARGPPWARPAARPARCRSRRPPGPGNRRPAAARCPTPAATPRDR